MRMVFGLRVAAIGGILLGCCAQAVAATERFSGSGVLTPADTVSSDGRLQLNAKLQPLRSDLSAGRFVLSARLSTGGAKESASTSCGPVIDGVFNNGFE